MVILSKIYRANHVRQVRKLYKYVALRQASSKDTNDKRNGKANQLDRMLEDPSYASVVRWGDEGDSFVVLEVGFTHMKNGVSTMLN